MKPLYTAVGTASDEGRSGRAWTPSRSLELQMTVPEDMGGPGGAGTNPEELFALGYSACFANAMRGVARRQRREEAVEGSTVTAHVDIGRVANGRFGLAVKFDVTVPKLPQDEAEELVAAAHERCPYSNVTRGNMPVEFTITGAS